MKPENVIKYDLEERLIEFGSRIIDVVESLPNSTTGKHLGAQLVRSGTAPALNYGEAQAAESRADFIHKMKIALKELRETKVNLKYILKRNYFPAERLLPLLKENDELIAIFIKSISTAQEKLKVNKYNPMPNAPLGHWTFLVGNWTFNSIHLGH